MQTLIDIPEADLTLLDRLSRDRQITRDELVRAAVTSYLYAQQLPQAVDEGAWKKAFGSWAHRGEDGLAYQERLRSEW